MCSENQIDKMFKISYMVHIERKEYPKDAIELLKKNNVKFGIWKLFNQKEELENIPEENNKEETITISIPKELYNKVEELCKINNLDTNDKIINILGDAVFSAEIDYEKGYKHVLNV